MYVRHGGLGEPDKLDHGHGSRISVGLKLRYDLLLVIHEEQRKVAVQEAGLIEGVLAEESISRSQPKAPLALLVLRRNVRDEEGCGDLDRGCERPGDCVQVKGSNPVLRNGLIDFVDRGGERRHVQHLLPEQSHACF